MTYRRPHPALLPRFASRSARGVLAAACLWAIAESTGCAAAILASPQTVVRCVVDSTQIDLPDTCTLRGAGTSFATLTLSPAVRLDVDATSPPIDISGIHGSSAFASLTYSFQVTGGALGDIVPILIVTNLFADGSDPTHGIGFAQIAVHTGVAGDSLVAVCSDGTCGTTGSSFSGTLRTRARSGDFGDILMLQVQASTGDSTRGETARASADPLIFVDPSFPNASLYRIVVSSGVANGVAVPEPATDALTGLGLLVWALRRTLPRVLRPRFLLLAGCCSLISRLRRLQS